MRRTSYRQTPGPHSPDTPYRVSIGTLETNWLIRLTAAFTRRTERGLLVLLALSSLVSAVTLNAGVAAAARNTLHPTIRAAGGTGLDYYAQAGSGDLLPNSQSVIKNPKVDLIFEDENSFWESTFHDPQVNYGKTLTNEQVVKQYFTDVSGSAFEGILSQYSGISNIIPPPNAVVLSMNSTLHSDLCGTKTISDSGTNGQGIAPDIWNAVTTQAPIDSSTIYFVFTPPNYKVYGPNDSCSQDNCGYHNEFLLGEGIYAVIPYGGGHCKAITSFSDTNDVQIDINTASHEQFEAITDPGAGQFGTSDGWHDSSGYGGEIGDKCGGALRCIIQGYSSTGTYIPMSRGSMITVQRRLMAQVYRRSVLIRLRHFRS